MEKIEHAQTFISLSEKKSLLEITKQTTTKEALRVAIEHTLATYKGV